MKQKIYLPLLFVILLWASANNYCNAACSVTINPNPVTTCTGNCITLTATASGIPPYQYVWSPGGQTTSSITVCPSFNSTYSVVVVDSANCSSTSSMTVTVGTPPVVTVYPALTQVCKGNCITLAATTSGRP